MNSYRSIETLYKRDKETSKLNFNEIRVPEWDLVNYWLLTEKVDGTNIRVIYKDGTMSVKGRSDNANIPGGLLETISKTMPSAETIAAEFEGMASITFYGEGYGPGIQGSDKMAYRTQEQGKAFRCFDIKFGGEEHDWWADFLTWDGICTKFNVPMTPGLGSISKLPMGREEALQMMSEWLPSSLTALQDSGTTIAAEGIVARPALPLFDRFGERLIWKLTAREFK